MALGQGLNLTGNDFLEVQVKRPLLPSSGVKSAVTR